MRESFIRSGVMAVRAPARVTYEEMVPELRTLLSARVERLGYLGEFFQIAAHQPAALASFITHTEELKRELPWRLVEVIALTVATATHNDYERVQHERLALRLGLGRGQISALACGALTTSDGFSEAEVTVAKLAECMVHSHGRACATRAERLVGQVGEAEAVACVMLIARYVAHAVMSNAWRLTPPVASPLTDATSHV